MGITAGFASSMVGLATAIGLFLFIIQPTRAEAPLPTDRLLRVQLAQITPSSVISATEKDAIHQAVSGYYDAFGRDSAAAAAFYGEPTVIVLPNQVITLATRADVEAFLARSLASLRPLGYSYSKVVDSRIRLLSATTSLYSTIAIRSKADGTEMQRAGFTYLLQKDNSGWKIRGLIATDLDKLLNTD